MFALGRYEYHSVQPGLAPHCHPGAAEICFLERGCQTYRVEGEEFRLLGGDILVVPPGLLHDTGGSPEDCGVLYWLILQLPEDSRTLLDLAPSDSSAVCDKLAHLPRMKFVGRPSLKQIFTRLFDLHDAPADSLKCLSIKHQLLCCILEVLHCAESDRERALSRDIRQAAQRIRSNPGEELSLLSLAEEVGLSLSRFKVKFREEMGIAPREYILRVKIDWAKKALADGNGTVTDVAMDLGFNTSQYFATVFKRFTQLTPLEFRRRRLNTLPVCPVPLAPTFSTPPPFERVV